MAARDIGDLLSIILAASKDEVYLNNVRQLQAAFHELIIAEASARRSKTDVIIRSMAKLDMEILRFKIEYNRISNQLTSEAQNAISEYLTIVEIKKNELVFEKNRLKVRK